jgi:adenylate cyclase class 2
VRTISNGMEEYEIKFLEVNVPALEKKLLEIGAIKTGEFDYIRRTFDYPDFRLDDKHKWLRIRTDGKETTLTYKERLGVKSNDTSIPDDGMKEIEVIVSDFEKTCEIMKSAGFILKHEAKNKRIRYEKGDMVYDIDSWPQIPTYIEIESTSLEKAKEAARELGFDGDKGIICSVNQVYKKYGVNLKEYFIISFDGMIKK